MRFIKGSTPWNKGKKFPQFSGKNHPNFKDLKGKKFGSLTVLNFYGKNKFNNSLWMCHCICGKHLTIYGSNLTRGLTKSCGCLTGKHISESKTKHGMCKTPAYYSWSGMIARCYKPKTDSYKYYGEKGIKVCKRWLKSFTNFFQDMGKSSKGMSLDRVNSKKNYNPNNCRWIPKAENARRAMMEKYHGNS